MSISISTCWALPTPPDPKLISFPARAHARSSSTLAAGTAGFTTSTIAKLPARVSGAKSLSVW